MRRAAEPLAEMPRHSLTWDGTRTPVKTALFLVVCLAWLVPGLAGHEPWKSDEAIVLGVVTEMLRSGNWLIPSLAGEPYLERAPLFFWTAAAFAKVFGGFLPLHDAARLAAGLCMAVAMAGVMVAAAALHGARATRISVLLLIGSFGLLIRAHEMTPDLAGFAGASVGLAGLALASRKPWLGGPLLGAALAVAFLGDGLMYALPIAVLAALMPAIGANWRTRGYLLAAAAGGVIGALAIVAWIVAVMQAAPAMATSWIAATIDTRWSGGVTIATLKDTVYFARILPWYAWPALPLAAWALWRARHTLAARNDLHLPLAAAAVFFVILSALAEARDVNALPLLLPLVLLGVAELDSLPRGAASALDWFGVTTFALLGILLWVGYFAALTGTPESVSAWLQREVPGFEYPFRFLPFALAALLSCIWVVVVARSLRTTRRAVVNWSAGITMVWMLTMTLGLPAIDQARSYRGLASRLATALGPAKCTIGTGLGDAQRALLDYYIGLRVLPSNDPRAAGCDALLAQVAPGRAVTVDAVRWSEVWRGSRPGDRSESFILYRRVD